jgi:hypothetical protein
MQEHGGRVHEVPNKYGNWMRYKKMKYLLTDLVSCMERDHRGDASVVLLTWIRVVRGKVKSRTRIGEEEIYARRAA